MQKTKQQIIDESLAYIKEHGRGLGNDGICAYYAENGKMCIVGRCLIDPEQMEGDEIGQIKDWLYNRLRNSSAKEKVSDVALRVENEFEQKLLPEYRGHEMNFWIELQDLHDKEAYWKERELTAFGEGKLNSIKFHFEIDKTTLN